MPFQFKKRSVLDSEVKNLKDKAAKLYNVEHDEVAINVSNNLFMRHKQLYWIEELTREHAVHQALLDEHDEQHTGIQAGSDHPRQSNAVRKYNAPRRYGKKPLWSVLHTLLKQCQSNEVASLNKDCHKNEPQDHSPKKLLPEERAYHLAVTDLFVEKAQAFLEQRAESYQRSGKRAHRIACVTIFIGAVFACQQMVNLQGDYAKSWLALTTMFTRAFTAYGMVVLAAVGLWRYGKAMLDQAERLYERRHALRQGRLFVHLNDGKLSIDEMEKAFKWNESQENAFANIHTEASAPWGAFAKEFLKNLPEIYKAGVQSLGKGKSEDK